MPTITASFEVTDAIRDKLQRWFATYNSQIDVPYANYQDCLDALFRETMISNVAAQDVPDFEEAWGEASDAQKAQIKDILGLP